MEEKIFGLTLDEINKIAKERSEVVDKNHPISSHDPWEGVKKALLDGEKRMQADPSILGAWKMKD
jgi:hypothetical protein